MKKLLFMLIAVLAISCSKEKKEETQSDPKEIDKVEIQKEAKPNVVEDFLVDVRTLEKAIDKVSIEDFKAIADKEADTSFKMNATNVKQILDKAKNYSECIIITGNHTIVKITDFNDCKPSKSWDTCVPKGEGFIKKGKLIYQNDYINYIMGTPDAQDRFVYLFR